MSAPGNAFYGTSLNDRVLALTFDDGPASRTLELSAYLKSQGIRAGFFINGQNVNDAAVLQQIVADGHILANHTQTHADLTSAEQFPAGAAGNDALVQELAATDAIISPFVPSGRFLFRAPFGAFDERAYSVLQASAMAKYVGHVEWDIGSERTATTGADWACWQDAPQLSTKGCGDLYLNEIHDVGRGIVLMHDADYGDMANGDPQQGTGNTIDMVKYLVPLLKAEGYSFARVDEVPAIAAALPPLPAQPDQPQPAQPTPAQPTPSQSASPPAAAPTTSAPPPTPPPAAAAADDPCQARPPVNARHVH